MNQVLMTRSAYGKYAEYHNMIALKGEFETAEGVAVKYYRCTYTDPRLKDGTKLYEINSIMHRFQCRSCLKHIKQSWILQMME
jgi:hypothetical protein